MYSNNSCEIRDVVYGFIKLDAQEKQIIDHPVYQRLRRIKQLGLTDMLYPGANHSRFEHSLGVMQMATEMYNCVIEKSIKFLRKYYSMNLSDIQRWQKIIRLAALLHDIGHSPFSHAGEQLFPVDTTAAKQYKHEDYSIAIIKTYFTDIIEGHRIGRKHSLKVEDITALLGEVKPDHMESTLLWKELISGQLDADRADYLLRDSLHLGVNYGIYDRNRLTRCMGVGLNDSGSPLLAIQDGGWHIAESLVIARYQMFSQVYFHRTRRAYDFHLSKAIKEILTKLDYPGGCYPPVSNLDKYVTLDDWFIFGELVKGNGGEHGDRILQRNHYRCAFETSPIPTAKEESDLADNKLKYEKQGLLTFIDDASTTWYKGDTEINVYRENDPKRVLKPLREISELVKCMTVKSHLKRLYKSNTQSEGGANESS